MDVGQVLFGSTTSMTGDGPLGYFLHQVTGKKWTSADTEMEATFNLGLGMLAVVPAREVEHALDAVRAAGHQAWDVGEIVDGHGHVHVDRA